MGLACSSHSSGYGPGIRAPYCIQHPSSLQRERGSTPYHVYGSMFRFNRALLVNNGQAFKQATC